MTENLTNNQKDYSIFLPAISGFYATYIGKQRYENFVDPSRIPSGFSDIESFNFLNPNQGEFKYKWALYSAGHADLDTTKFVSKEDMIRNRDPGSFVIGDSGGFQIGKGVWEGDWKNPSCPKAQQKRESVVKWMDSYMNYGMMLDIPSWTFENPEASRATGINSVQDALDATKINAHYFMQNRNGNCKFLNVLQGQTRQESDFWYNEVKEFCDPKKHINHFDGWAFGGRNVYDAELALKRIVDMHFDGLLQQGIQDWLHCLGVSKLEWAVFYTEVQRAVRENYNQNFTISFDCASPFLATANGQVYYNNVLKNHAKWSYQMKPSPDDKKYSTDTRLYGPASVQDGYFDLFQESVISKKLLMKDICYYTPGQVNKNNKVGRTSWDSFSYMLLMAHNVYLHIKAVQDGNDLWDSGICPRMLFHKLHGNQLKQCLNDVFTSGSRTTAYKNIKKYSVYLNSLKGNKTSKQTPKDLLGKHFDIKQQNIVLDQPKKEFSINQTFDNFFS